MMLEDDEVRIRRLLVDSREKTRKKKRTLLSTTFVLGCLVGLLASQSLEYIKDLQAERDAALRQIEAMTSPYSNRNLQKAAVNDRNKRKSDLPDATPLLRRL